MNPSCVECRRLLQAFKDALTAQTIILGRIYGACSDHDTVMWMKGEPSVREAADLRKSTRRDLDDHQATHYRSN